MIQEFGGDYRIYRVCMESSDPIETYHKIKMGHYSIATFLDVLELLDVRDTIREDKIEMDKKEKPQQPSR